MSRFYGNKIIDRIIQLFANYKFLRSLSEFFKIMYLTWFINNNTSGCHILTNFHNANLHIYISVVTVRSHAHLKNTFSPPFIKIKLSSRITYITTYLVLFISVIVLFGAGYLKVIISLSRPCGRLGRMLELFPVSKCQ